MRQPREPGRDDAYVQMLRLADLLDTTSEQLRHLAHLGEEVLLDGDVTGSADLSPLTWHTAEEEVRAATTGEHGLLARSVELDADALMVRATVHTYRWIDDLALAAERTMGSIAGRAIGYLAPEVELGGAIVSVGLIETDALDRDGVAGYLDELAQHNPVLLNHATSGGGGLLEGLQLRALLTASVLTGELGSHATLGGLRAVGAEPLSPDVGSALRDAAAGLLDPDEPTAAGAAAGPVDAPRSLGDLLTTLSTTPVSVTVQQVAPHRWIAYLPGTGRSSHGRTGRLRLVGGDHSAYAERVVAAVQRAVHGDHDARVMLVGAAEGGLTAAEIAAAGGQSEEATGFVVDQLVTAGAPSSHLPRIPDHTRVLALEDRSDPVALLGSLVNAHAANRLTVVFDGEGASGAEAYVAGGRAADAADHPALRAELTRLRADGWLAG